MGTADPLQAAVTWGVTHLSTYIVIQQAVPSITIVKMVVPDAVKDKVGPMPDVSAMGKDDLAALCQQLYDQSCNVFAEKFHMEYQVKKRDMEIHNMEMETSESHGSFKIPKLKKVNKFKSMGDEEEK